MKVRNGFVSNSSSSSFIIEKSKLTEEQLEQIRNHKSVVETPKFKAIRHDLEERSGDDLRPNDYWDISENNEYIFGYTIIDNFDMELFFELIGVDSKDVTFYGDVGLTSVVKHHKKWHY